MKTSYKISPLLTLLLASTMLGGCADNAPGPSASVGADLTLGDFMTPLTSVELISINGTYGASCIERSGDWSLGAGGAYLEHPVLSVVMANDACVLTMTEVRAGTVQGDVYVADTAIELTGAYSATAASFALAGLGPVIFYGNSKLNSTTFTSDFSVSFLYSDDPALVGASPAASYEVVSSSFVEGALVSPDYTIDVTELSIQVDANQIVQTVGGTAQLMDGLVTGQDYVVESGALGATPSYAQIDAAYIAGTKVAISTTDPTIAAAAFGLTGSDLTGNQVRNVIVANEAEGLGSYQVFRVTFNPAGT